MPTPIRPSKYAIELRSKSPFNLKARIEPFITNLSWEWNRIGGCGRCSFTLEGDYVRLAISADDDIWIYLPNEGGGSTLWYRGYVERVTPQLSGPKQNIRVECMGYSGWFERLIVQASGGVKTYTNTEISAIVTDIINTYVVPNTNITMGVVDVSTFTPDTLEFKGTVKDALRTLFDLLGNIEYGVDADLRFYWRIQLGAVQHKFWIGDKVTQILDRLNFDQIVNRIYFEGGKMGGVTFTQTGDSTISQSQYGLHEEIISNGSIVTPAVASQYISGIFAQRSKPTYERSFSLKNTKTRFEENVPLGLLSVIDPNISQIQAIYGTAANGGSNKIYGTAAHGGSNQLYGGFRKDSFDRVKYSPSPMDGRVDAEVQLGTSLGYSLASAELRQLELSLESVRQRDL